MGAPVVARRGFGRGAAAEKRQTNDGETSEAREGVWSGESVSQRSACRAVACHCSLSGRRWRRSNVGSDPRVEPTINFH